MSELGEYPPNIEQLKKIFTAEEIREFGMKVIDVERLQNAIDEYYEEFDPEVDGI